MLKLDTPEKKKEIESYQALKTTFDHKNKSVTVQYVGGYASGAITFIPLPETVNYFTISDKEYDDMITAESSVYSKFKNIIYKKLKDKLRLKGKIV